MIVMSQNNYLTLTLISMRWTFHMSKGTIFFQILFREKTVTLKKRPSPPVNGKH